jgi:hypothetical protein
MAAMALSNGYGVCGSSWHGMAKISAALAKLASASAIMKRAISVISAYQPALIKLWRNGENMAKIANG